MFKAIQSVKLQPDGTMRLTFADGVSGILDLTELARQGGAFAPLADPEVAACVQIGEGGRFLIWPGEIDLCADALWMQIQDHPRVHAACASGAKAI